MKNLTFFCNQFAYKLDHPTPVAESSGNIGDQEAFQNILVVFSAIEPHDSKNAIIKVASDLRKIARKNNTKKIIVNPFAHLSSNLAKPAQAIQIIDHLVETINKENEFEAKRLHFGWYKEFNIMISGKDNAQIFREYC